MSFSEHYGPCAVIAGASEGTGRAAKGLPVPANIADPERVAALGLERLPFGPIQNWGLNDDDAGYAVLSASDRRKRVIAIEAVSTHVFGKAS